MSSYISVNTPDGSFQAYIARPAVLHAPAIVTLRKGADASVVYYGGDTEKHLDEAHKLDNPLLMHLGEEDEYISKQAQRAIIEALEGNACAHVFSYPGCSHAFARHRGQHYDKEAAALANGRTADFFRSHLG
jgi:carboxymethylenebutenolidase